MHAQKRLDLFDLRILEGLGNFGPRNVTAVARQLGVPEATLRRRLKRMLSQVFLQANVYHTNIGLKKVIVFAKAFQGHENLLYKCLDLHDYLIYISRCFGAYEGCVSIFAIPTDHCADFEFYLNYLQEKGVAENIQHHWSTCFQSVNIKCSWYHEELKEWVFPWKEWIQQVLSEGTELPFTLKDPKEYPLKADNIDIFILKELESNATTTLKEIATKLNVSVPLVKYHFDNHVVSRQLLEDFQIIYYPFDKTKSNGFFFTFTFDNLENMAKFARSLLDKPFVFSVGKIFGESSLFAYIYLPFRQFRKLVESLGKLIRMGFLRKYDYVMQDMEKVQRYSIPYRSFINESWLFSPEKYVKKVDELVEEEGLPLTDLREVAPYLEDKAALR